MLRAGIDNLPVTGSDRFSGTRESMTMKRIGVSQEWLSADKRAAREGAARARADRDAVQKDIAEAEARLQVSMAYVDAWFATEALKLTTQTEHHLHEELNAAKSRIAAATGNSAEALQLLSAKGIAEDESEEVRQQQSAAMVSLQRWIGILPDALNKPPAFPAPEEWDYVARYPAVAGLKATSKLLARVQTSQPRSALPTGPGKCPTASALAIPIWFQSASASRSKSHQASAKTAKPRPSWPWSTKQRLT
jgi:outer membrane protein TolC